MAIEKHTKQIQRGANSWNTWRRRAGPIRPDLRGADLNGADLIEANLIGADLSLTDLRGATLVGADLSRANLSGADLIDTSLINATLNRADLSGAHLRHGPESFARAISAISSAGKITTPTRRASIASFAI